MNHSHHCFKPQRGKFTRVVRPRRPNRDFCFKPQRGKFTLYRKYADGVLSDGFKPQRGKFTRDCADSSVI